MIRSIWWDKYRFSVGGWPERLLLDTTDTGTFNGGDVDVSWQSPCGTPWVSDDVVVYSSLGSVSDSGDGVIEGGSASGSVKDSTGVSLESRSVGLNGDGCWSLSNSSLQLGDRVGWDVLVGDDVVGGGLLVSTGSVSGGVSVLRLVLSIVGLEVGESVSLPSTIASVGGWVAVNNFLLSEALELAGGNEMMSLEGGDGGESPAWTALSLVLDGVDGSLGSPVDGGGEAGLVKELNVSLSLLSSESEVLLELVLSHGGEHVVSNSEGVLWVRVDDNVLGILGGEDGKSELVLLGGSVGKSVLGDVLNERWLDHGADDWGLVAVGWLESEEPSNFAESVHLFV
jgi:hypothetical protein